MRNSTQIEITPGQSKYTVTLRRGPQGFGFSIRGGMDFERIPLFVFRIAQGGPAQLDGQMQVRCPCIALRQYTSFVHLC